MKTTDRESTFATNSVTRDFFVIVDYGTGGTGFVVRAYSLEQVVPLRRFRGIIFDRPLYSMSRSVSRSHRGSDLAFRDTIGLCAAAGRAY